ncbi:MAG TPA: hypothetical protein VND64_33410 [Pirellulales bacterium]|nr:hypothetical protein [Pirellulales bacterium]
MSIVDRSANPSWGLLPIDGPTGSNALPPPVIAITDELFPGPISVSTEADPEAPSQSFLVLTVEASGEVREIVQRRREWHVKAEPFLVGWDVRLSIIPK